MKKNRIIIICIITLFINGCYNYTELNNLAIASTIGIDKSDKEYQVTIQIVNTDTSEIKTNNNTSNEFILYHSNGVNLTEALNNLNNIIPKKIYLNHLMAVIISEDVANKNINDVFDYLLRDPRIREDFNVIIAKDNSAKEILDMMTTANKENPKNIVDIIKNTNQINGTTIYESFHDTIKKYLNKYQDIVLPSIKIDSDKQITISDVAIFKNDKLINSQDKTNCLIINLINNNIKEANITIPYEKDYFSVKIIKSKTTFESNINNYSFNINVKLNAVITDLNKNFNLTNNNTIIKLENIINNYLENKTNETIDDTFVKHQSDVFGITNYIYTRYPNQFNDKEIYNKLNIKTNIKTKITTQGNTK